MSTASICFLCISLICHTVWLCKSHDQSENAIINLNLAWIKSKHGVVSKSKVTAEWEGRKRPNPEARLGATELPGSAWSKKRFLLTTQQGETVKQMWHPLSLRVTLKEVQQQMLQVTCQDWQQTVGAVVIDLNWRPWRHSLSSSGDWWQYRQLGGENWWNYSVLSFSTSAPKRWRTKFI